MHDNPKYEKKSERLCSDSFHLQFVLRMAIVHKATSWPISSRGRFDGKLETSKQMIKYYLSITIRTISIIDYVTTSTFRIIR